VATLVAEYVVMLSCVNPAGRSLVAGASSPPPHPASANVARPIATASLFFFVKFFSSL
jgi:hypothetical protein